MEVGKKNQRCLTLEGLEKDDVVSSHREVARRNTFRTDVTVPFGIPCE